MKNVVFSEKRNIEKIILSGEVSQDNVVHVISSMAKYNYSINNMSDKDNYNAIVKWLSKNYKYYVETELNNVILSKIHAAHTYQLLESNDLVIYRSEMDAIQSADNIREEKVLFVLLCIAKLQKNIFKYNNGKYKFPLTNIFKLARVHIKSTDRGMFMNKLLTEKFINPPFRVDDEHRYVNFMSDGVNDEVVLTVNEQDFEELAYVYENWKNGGVGFTRCQKCNKLIRQSKNGQQKYCKECAEYTKIVDKTVVCIDCGNEFVVNAMASKACRCEECREKHLKLIKSEQNKRYYQSKKQKSCLSENG